MTKRPAKRTPTKAPVPPRHWMDVVRWLILVEIVVLAGLTLYLSSIDFAGGARDVLALAIMLLWVIAPGMIAYYAARPRKRLAPRLTWGLVGFLGNLWMIWMVADLTKGEGGSTAALGLVVAPFYVLLAMMAAQIIPVIVNMVTRHKL